ncbi:hypothetical protein M8494_17385 [Serratia ureilytica]
MVGKKANRDHEKGGYFYESDLNDVAIEAKDYDFNRPFGIPVRYHDYGKLKNKSN